MAKVEVPAPIAVLDEPVVAGTLIEGQATPHILQWHLEYPWSEWSEWQTTEWEDVGEPREVGRSLIASKMTLFKVLRYDEHVQYAQQQRRMVYRTRHNANRQTEYEREFQYRTVTR